MPNDKLDDDVDPLANDEDAVDAADEDEDEFEDEEDEDDQDLEDEGDLEARGALTHEVGSEGGSPGENMELLRATSGPAQGSEGTETLRGGGTNVVERRDAADVLINRAP